MAELTMFLICESMKQEQGATFLSNPMAFIKPAAIPGNFSFTISFGVFVIKNLDIHKVSISIIHPDGTDNNLFHDYSLPAVPDAQLNKQVGLSMNVDIRNYVFNNEGVYQFVLLIDGEKLTHSFYVYTGR